MSFFETLDQPFSALIVFILGMLTISYLCKTFKLNLYIALLIYFYHTIYAFLYAKMTIHINGGDSLVYYLRAIEDEVSFGLGTKFVISFVDLLYTSFNLSYFGVFLVFNIFGSIGLLAFYASLKDLTRDYYSKLTMLIVLLPSINFWTVSIGKDSLTFMGICLIMWGFLNNKNFLFYISLIIIFCVRPHISGFFLISYVVYILLVSNFKIYYKGLMFVFFSSMSFFAIKFILDYIGLGNLQNLTQLIEYIELRQSYNQDGGGGIDISNMTLFEQVYTYLFRPLPYEVHSFGSLLASFDNFFLLFFFIIVLFKLIIKRIKIKNYFFVFYILISLIFLSSTTSNLGISVRQKWMVMPFLLYIGFYILIQYKILTRKMYA